MESGLTELGKGEEGGALKPVLEDRFPREDYEDAPLPEHLPLVGSASFATLKGSSSSHFSSPSLPGYACLTKRRFPPSSASPSQNLQESASMGQLCRLGRGLRRVGLLSSSLVHSAFSPAILTSL